MLRNPLLAAETLDLDALPCHACGEILLRSYEGYLVCRECQPGVGWFCQCGLMAIGDEGQLSIAAIRYAEYAPPVRMYMTDKPDKQCQKLDRSIRYMPHWDKQEQHYVYRKGE